jgi:hypothetical protein
VYGYPGLDFGQGVTGASILRYLVQQATDPGTDPWEQVGQLRYRSGIAALQPVFATLGGTFRTEATLQGEFLLQFYADGHVSGASPRILHQGFDLASPLWEIPGEQSFPLALFQVDASVPSTQVIPLSTPDGVVFELITGAQSGVHLAPVGPGALSLAVVRR